MFIGKKSELSVLHRKTERRNSKQRKVLEQLK
jgi:hypothetical protein